MTGPPPARCAPPLSPVPLYSLLRSHPADGVFAIPVDTFHYHHCFFLQLQLKLYYSLVFSVEMSNSSKCSSRQSHSDYCSLGSSYSSDEEIVHHTYEEPEIQKTEVDEYSPLAVGTCPHCNQIFEQVSLK